MNWGLVKTIIVLPTLEKDSAKTTGNMRRMSDAGSLDFIPGLAHKKESQHEHLDTRPNVYRF
jgi:hypothetical protein